MGLLLTIDRTNEASKKWFHVTVLTSAFPEEETCMHARLNNEVRQQFSSHPLVPCATLVLLLLLLGSRHIPPISLQSLPKENSLSSPSPSKLTA